MGRLCHQNLSAQSFELGCKVAAGARGIILEPGMADGRSASVIDSARLGGDEFRQSTLIPRNTLSGGTPKSTRGSRVVPKSCEPCASQTHRLYRNSFQVSRDGYGSCGRCVGAGCLLLRAPFFDFTVGIMVAGRVGPLVGWRGWWLRRR